MPFRGNGGSWGTRTPGDILYYLFVMANNDTRTTAVVVSQVCKRWRAVAVTSPTLWTKISMLCIRANQQHPWTVTYLKRSQNLPISFHLKASRRLTSREIEVVLIRHAYRFRRFRVLASNYHLTLTLWPQLSQAMPSLTHFEYRIIGDIHVHIQRNARATGPFHIAGASRHGVIEWAKWDTSTITSLMLNYIGPEAKLSLRDFREIFTHCRDTLAHLELLGFAPTYDKKRPVPRITLPALETLSLGYIDNIVPFVELVHTPILQSFTLRNIITTPENHLYEPKRDWYGGMRGTNVGRIFELMQGVPLRHLAIFGEQFGFVEFRGFLLGLTGLKSLVLYAAAEAYYDVLFDGEVLLPSLSDLLITYVDHTRSLGPFLRRRAEAELPLLQKLTLTNDCVLLMESEEELLEEIMEGCSSISAITDPILGTYNVVAEGEWNILIDGAVVV